MQMFRWIVNLIRDDYDVDEIALTRTAVLETDCGLSIEQIEGMLDTIGSSFGVHFPPSTSARRCARSVRNASAGGHDEHP